MPAAVKTQADEAKWTRAKQAAAKQGQEGNYRLIMHIFQQMKKGCPSGGRVNVNEDTLRKDHTLGQIKKLVVAVRGESMTVNEAMDKLKGDKASQTNLLRELRTQKSAMAKQFATPGQPLEVPGGGAGLQMGKAKKKKDEDEEEGAAKPMPMPGIPAEAVRKGLSFGDLVKATQMGLFGGGTGAAPTGRGGEGSRGGKVVGHTKGGMPIYEGSRAAHHVKTAKDHGLAATHLSQEETTQRVGVGKTTLDSLRKQHKSAEEAHERAAETHGISEKTRRARGISSDAAETHSRTAQALSRGARTHQRWADHPDVSTKRWAKPPKQGEAKTDKDKSTHHGYKQDHHHIEAAHAVAEGDQAKARLHLVASQAHGVARDAHENKRTKEGKDRDYHGRQAWEASSATGLGSKKTEKAMTDPFDALIKAANGEPPAKPMPGKTATAPPAAAAKPAANGEEEEEEGDADEEGTHDHHKDRALAHLQAAQAHATAAHSAKKVEAAQEHGKVVGDAQQASDAAQAMAPEAPGKEAGAKGKEQPVKKSVPFNSHTIDVSSEEAVLAHLEGGGVVGGQMAGLPHDGRAHLFGMRGERLEKGVAGGTVYQGEHDEPRGGDMRESVARAQCYANMMHLDPDNTRGQGGLPEWWEDAWHNNPDVKVPVGLENSRAWAKSAPPAVNIIDDDDPVTKAHRSDVNRKGMAVEMAAHGGGREYRRDGQ